MAAILRVHEQCPSPLVWLSGRFLKLHVQNANTPGLCITSVTPWMAWDLQSKSWAAWSHPWATSSQGDLCASSHTWHQPSQSCHYLGVPRAHKSSVLSH